MTSEEAVSLLMNISAYDIDNKRGMQKQEALEMAIKALEQQQNRCDSCVHSEEQDGSNCYECVKGMADNFETQPTDADCISKQDVDALVDELARAISDERCCISRGRSTATIMQDILDLPSVTSQPKMGRWEYVQYDNNPNIGNWHCSECRTIIPHMPVETDRTPIYKWCPMCGANMEVEE